MIDYFERFPHSARAVLLIVAAIMAGSLLIVFSWLWKGWWENFSQVEHAVPRIERLNGYLNTENELRATSVKLGKYLEQLSYPASADSNQSGAQLQQSLRGHAEESGMTVSGSQLVQQAPRDDLEGFEVLVVELTMHGTPEALDEFLASVTRHKPLLLVSKLRVREGRDSRRSGRRSDDEKSNLLVVSVNVQALKMVSQ